MKNDNITDIYTYMRLFATDLGERILERYPALHQFSDPVSPRLATLLRTPFPAQSVAIMGIVKRWQIATTALAVAECGAGKTLISLGAMHVSSEGQPYTAVAMVPPHLVQKWAREAFLTIPGIRVFLIDDMRNGGDTHVPHGINEVRLRGGTIVREGLQTTLSDLRLRKQFTSSRKRWLSLCRKPALFIVGRERAKLGYFWRHAYQVPRSGPNLGCGVNSDTGRPVVIDERRLTQDGIIFAESGYSLHTLRQASRRSWRIGQRQPVRVKFMCCDQTLQAACLRLMGKKLLVALTMEGKFAGEGLQTMDQDHDMLSAMARELVEKNGIGETADNVWRALTREHQKLFPTSSNVPQSPSEVVRAPSMLALDSEPARLIEDN